MTAPRVAVFDLGKVLVDFDYTIAARKIAARCGSTLDPVRLFADRAGMLHRYELGGMSTAEFCGELGACCGFPGTPDELGELFGDIFSPIPDMIAVHAALRRNGFPSFIFSNTNELAIRHIRRHFPFFAGFDGYVFSYEHRSMKPDARLYEVVEEMTGRRGDEILYIDDRPENIRAGMERGWRTVLHETPEQSIAAFRRSGLIGPDDAVPAVGRKDPVECR